MGAPPELLNSTSGCCPEAHIPTWAAPRAGQAKPTCRLCLAGQASHPPAGHPLGVRRPPLPPALQTLWSWGRRACRVRGWGDSRGAAPRPHTPLRSAQRRKISDG